MRGTTELPTFCVLNSVYMAHAKGYKRSSPPRMSVDASGIPGLRAALLSLPAHLKFEATVKYHQSILPSFLNDIEIRLSERTLEQKDKLQKIALEAQQVSKQLRPFTKFTDARNSVFLGILSSFSMVYAQSSSCPLSPISVSVSLQILCPAANKIKEANKGQYDGHALLKMEDFTKVNVNSLWVVYGLC